MNSSTIPNSYWYGNDGMMVINNRILELAHSRGGLLYFDLLNVIEEEDGPEHRAIVDEYHEEIQDILMASSPGPIGLYGVRRIGGILEEFEMTA